MSSDISAYFSNALADLPEIDRTASESQKAHTLALSSAVLPIPTEERSDEDLLVQVGSGNKEALSVLFQRHGHAVYSVARRVLRDDSEAEDLLQDLFIYIFQKAQSFDADKGSGSSWIIQLAYHRAIDRRRYLGFRQHYKTQELDEERLFAQKYTLLIDGVSGRALLTKLRRECSVEQIQTLELHFFEGYSFQEIAEKTGQTFGNVRNHYYRGIKRLRSYIFSGKANTK